jgi:hypothetical protein
MSPPCKKEIAGILVACYRIGATQLAATHTVGCQMEMAGIMVAHYCEACMPTLSLSRVAAWQLFHIDKLSIIDGGIRALGNTSSFCVQKTTTDI